MMVSRNNTHIDKGINFSSFIIGYKLGVTNAKALEGRKIQSLALYYSLARFVTKKKMHYL
jgi:hypothetical protein